MTDITTSTETQGQEIPEIIKQIQAQSAKFAVLSTRDKTELLECTKLFIEVNLLVTHWNQQLQQQSQPFRVNINNGLAPETIIVSPVNPQPVAQPQTTENTVSNTDSSSASND